MLKGRLARTNNAKPSRRPRRLCRIRGKVQACSERMIRQVVEDDTSYVFQRCLKRLKGIRENNIRVGNPIR